MDRYSNTPSGNTSGGEEWLIDNGFELLQSKLNLEENDSARDYIVKLLRHRLEIRDEIEDKIIIGRIIYFLCNVRKLQYYKQIPNRDEAEDFIVVYSDFFMDSLSLIEEFDERPLGHRFHLTYWAHVEEVKETGDVLVSSKTVGGKVYKHKVDNNLILDSFCNHRESFVYINIFTIKQFFLNMLQREHS